MRMVSEFEYYLRDLDDGRTISVVPLLYGRARVNIGPTGGNYFDSW